METIHINLPEDLYKLYAVLKVAGHWVQPRGERTLEIENFSYVCQPYIRYNNFAGRNFNLKYLKREMAWYIKADPTDLSIAEHASQWGKIIANGKLNSNYGSYWFGRYGVENIVAILQQDPMSRRAVIPMYGTDIDHMDLEAKDVPCTIAIEFRIRHGALNARAIMRSQDILWGMTNDLPTFSFLQEIVAARLKVPMGTLTVAVGSFHVYESRMDMFNNIIIAHTLTQISDPAPKIEHEEALLLSNKTINPNMAFGKWLMNI